MWYPRALAGMLLLNNFEQVGGRSLFKSCGAAGGPGGGLHVAGNLSHMAGELKVKGCEADAGGGLAVGQHISAESNMSVAACTAKRSGPKMHAMLAGCVKLPLTGCCALVGGVVRSAAVLKQHWTRKRNCCANIY